MTQLLGNARIVSLLTILSQLVAFVRTAIIASLFGASSLVDSYYLALVIPVLLAGVIGGWMQAGFVGRYIECCRKSNPIVATSFRGAMGVVVFTIALLAALLIALGSEFLSTLLVPATSMETRLQTEVALRIAAWSLVPTALGDYFGLVLNCHGRFFSAAAAPVANALVSASALWAWPHQNLDALVWTLILGWLVQLGMLVFSYVRAGLGFISWRPGIEREVFSTMRLALPILPGIFFSNATLMVIQLFCSRLGEGAVALYGYASRLHGALTQVMIIGISTVLLPHLASMLADNQRQEIKILFRRIGRATLLVSLFVLSGILILGEPAIMVLLGRGKFDQALAASVSEAWAILSLSLFPFALATFFAKLFQAMRQPGLLSIAALVSLIATGFVCYVGSATLGFAGVMLAPLIAQVAVLVFFLSCFRKKFGKGRFLPDWMRTVGWSGLVVMPSLLVDLGLRDHLTTLGTELAFGLRASLFAGIFLLAAKFSGVIRWITRAEPS